MLLVGQQHVYTHHKYIYALCFSYARSHLKISLFVNCLEDDQENPNTNELKFKDGRIAQTGMCKHFLLNSWCFLAWSPRVAGSCGEGPLLSHM